MSGVNYSAADVALLRNGRWVRLEQYALEINTLRAQLEAAEAERDLFRTETVALTVDCLGYKNRAEAAEADAARYRWLRQGAGFADWKLPEMRVTCPDNLAGCRYKHTREVSGASLDEAIDAAMSRTKEETK